MVGGLVGASTAQATFPGVNGKIAWMSDRDDPEGVDIWIANADGSNPINLSADVPGVDRSPSFSPDGSQIAFERNSKVMVMNADGSGAREIPIGTIQFMNYNGPAFGADGKTVVFEGREGTNDNIYSVNIDGPPNVQNLTPSVPQQDTSPAVSPDGNRIAFVSYRPGSLGGGDIYVANANGSSPQNLSQRTAVDSTADFSPDSSNVLWASVNAGAFDLFEAPAAGGAPTPFAPTPGVVEYQPAYSPDGTQRLYTTTRFGGDDDIVVADSSGQVVSNVSEPGVGSATNDLEATWAVAVEVTRSVALQRKGRKKLVGTIESTEPGCVSDTPVSLFRKRKGPDKELGTPTTDAEADFKLKRRKPLEGKFYATIAREERSGVAICLDARSPRVARG